MRTICLLCVLSYTYPLFAADSPSKYALFIGVSKYNHAEMNKPQLEFPELDAKELAEIFRKAGYTVDLLLGKDATQAAIKEKLSQVNKKGDADGVVVIGLFGHGVEFEDTKLACYCPFDTAIRIVLDSKGRQISKNNGTALTEPNPESLITMADLLAALRTSPAGNRILLADCCRNDPNRARGRAFGANVKMDDLPKNTAALFACEENEQAFEHKTWNHGAFTKCLIDEIKKHSSTDITANQLSVDLQRNVQKLVSTISDGRNKQTVNPLVNGVVEFKFSSSTPVVEPSPKTPIASMLNAPFGREAANSAQEAWAKSCGRAVLTKNSIEMELVTIPPGKYLMGNDESVSELQKLFPDAIPDLFTTAKQHEVRITKPFLLGKFEVTNSQFRQFVDATGFVTEPEKDAKGGWGYDPVKKIPVQDKRFSWRIKGFIPPVTNDDPVVNVTWSDSVAFCNWLSRKEEKPEYYRINANSVTVVGGNGYRLPTEAEWEYACRAGTLTRYYNGNRLEELVKIGNVFDAQAKAMLPNRKIFLNANDGFAFTSPVGRFTPNNFGLYDMLGNAFEWCNDFYSTEYDEKIVDDPQGPSTGTERVDRGGGWSHPGGYNRSASRRHNPPTHRFSSLGFRIAASISKE